MGFEHTVAFRQLLNCDWVVFGRIELNRGFGLEALGLCFVVGHCVCIIGLGSLLSRGFVRRVVVWNMREKKRGLICVYVVMLPIPRTVL